nr:dehydrogenase/reductase SDR family member 7C-B-like [Oncorhynchus nerka]
MTLYATENYIPIGLFQSMDPAAILLVHVVVVVTAVVIFLHSLVLKFLSTATNVQSCFTSEELESSFVEKLEGFADNLTSAADPKLTFPPKLVLVDFGDMNSMPDVIAETLECCGCVDVLILNSSLKVKAPVQSTSLKMDRLIMDNNYFGPITVAKGLLPSMMSRRTGHVILVNSIQGKLAMPFRATYAASKHAVQAFFDCLRAEVREYGISVSTVNHTFIISPPFGENCWSDYSNQP